MEFEPTYNRPPADISEDKLAIEGLRQSAEQNKSKPAQEVNNFIKQNQASLVVFAGDKTIHYVPSESAETMAFYHKEGKVELPEKWFQGEYTNDELLFGCGHELAHFADMRHNPEAYIGCFDYAAQKGHELAEEYHQKHPEQGSEESMAHFFEKELHTFYNYLDDIYVNKLAADKAPAFHGNKRDVVVGLYEKVGWKEPDLTKQPLHRQMVFALLRDEMVGDEFGKSLVDERVSDILETKKMGKNARGIIDAYLKPVGGIPVDPGERYKAIRALLEEPYINLLKKALEEKNQQQDESQSGEGGGNDGDQNQQGEAQGSDNFNPFGDQESPSPELFSEQSPEKIKQTLDDIIEQNKVDQMSGEERAEYKRKKAQEIFDKQHGITQKERKQYQNIVNQIGPEREEMRRFWKNLIGKSISYERQLVENQRRGKLNIGSLIRHYPNLVESQQNGNLDELAIYDRFQTERKIINKPEEIDITLLIDSSGSMYGERMDVARQAAALLMLSIKDFNNYLENNRREIHSNLCAKTEVVMFGSEHEKIKSFEKRAQSNSQEEAEMIKSLNKMQAEYGGTNDAAPLHGISDSITPEQKSKIKAEKLLKIVFEITDGEPDDSWATKQAVEALKSEGAIVFAFQVGEKNVTFDEIWNQSGQKTGIFIGDSIKELPTSLMQTLSNIMKGIRI